MPTLEQLNSEKSTKLELDDETLRDFEARRETAINAAKQLKKQSRSAYRKMLKVFKKRNKNANVILSIQMLCLGFAVGSVARLCIKLDMPGYDGHIANIAVAGFSFIMYLIMRSQYNSRAVENSMLYSHVSAMSQLTYSIDMHILMKLQGKFNLLTADAAHFALVENYNSIINCYNDCVKTTEELENIQNG